MNATDYKPDWPGEAGIDPSRCRATAFEKSTGTRRQCRMRPIADGLCRHHAKSEGMTAACPICLAPSSAELCDTCESAWLEANPGAGSEIDLIRWVCDRARACLRARLTREK